MQFDNTLEVPLPPAEAWAVLLDIKRIATCIPGAELTEVVDENTYKGKVAVRLGPVAMSLAGQARFEEIDHANHTARVRAQGSDPKGRGSSDSTILFSLEPAASGTRVLIHTDVKLSGAIAQYGRGSGMIQSLASQLIGQFGENLKAQLDVSPHPDPLSASRGEGSLNPPSPAPRERDGVRVDEPRTKPISGFKLLFKSFWHSISRWFDRKRGRRPV